MTETDLVECPLDDCFYPDTNCSAGHVRAQSCPHIVALHDDHEPETDGAEDTLFPWTGRAFGLTDLRFISAHQRPHVIGLAGPADAGKTTLLAMLFLMMTRGIRITGGQQFAGSYTLQAWENIARWLQLNSDGPVQYPPHTTSQTGRHPGLLHLRVSEENHGKRDIILTDAPGEWFTDWVTDVDAETAAGARWTATFSDKLLIVADTKALTGSNGGPARNTLEFLIRRVASGCNHGEVALVWTKTDIPRPSSLIKTIETHFENCFPDAPVFQVQVPTEATDSGEPHLSELTAVFAWSFAGRQSKIAITLPKSTQADPFLSYRGRDHA
ncbi:MAG: hypothetical protein IIA09_10220 [Proteobacteria bacterium]|nr:hypothetical protein [Pseudomonadota bacterium]